MAFASAGLFFANTQPQSLHSTLYDLTEFRMHQMPRELLCMFSYLYQNIHMCRVFKYVYTVRQPVHPLGGASVAVKSNIE